MTRVVKSSMVPVWLVTGLLLAFLFAGCSSSQTPFQSLFTTPSATPTATSIPTSTPTPSPTATPTVTPTPTPVPAERLKTAEQALHNGDTGTAMEVYREVISRTDEADLTARAWWGLGMAALQDNDPATAIASFRALLTAPPSGLPAIDVADVQFLLGDALMQAERPLEAAEAYRGCLTAGTVITAYIQQSLGNALYAGGAYTEAVEAYGAAIAAAPDRSFEVGTREQLALTYVALQDYPSAVAQYEAILDVARIRSYRARIERQLAETLLLAGQTEAGYERLQAVVETYPDEYYAYLSLITLVEAGRPVNDFLRGVVDYYNGAYGPAVEALGRYVMNDPEGHSGDAHWYAGLAYLAAGSPHLAANEFQLLIETHPENAHVGDAWMGLAQAYANAGNVNAAVETYRQFAALLPDHARAPEALWEAAHLLEQENDLAAAGEAYMDCHVAYPHSDYGPQALFRAGLQSYRLDDLVNAAVAWDTLSSIYPDDPTGLAAGLWLGKLRLRQGDQEAAQMALETVIETDPRGYYGLRATDIRASLSPTTSIFSPRYPSESSFALTALDPEAQTKAERWLAGWLGVEVEAGQAPNIGALPADLQADPRLERGLTLWRLGRFEEAKWELEALRTATRSDALTQYRLALLFREIGLYRSSILCAAQVVSLSPVEHALEAPAFIARLVYPTYYDDLVLENARRYDLPPWLLFALIRQESLFESLAVSSASAHGLMQVIPPTGEEINAELDWPPGYRTTDLYRPYVSLRFGSYYLSRQRDRFDDRMAVALAAYNGGPSNAHHWWSRANGDPDLFRELITLHETYLYITRIKEHLIAYQALYEVE